MTNGTGLSRRQYANGVVIVLCLAWMPVIDVCGMSGLSYMALVGVQLFIPTQNACWGECCGCTVYSHASVSGEADVMLTEIIPSI